MENPYTDILIKYYKSDKNRGELPNATHRQRGRNATCGDDLTLDFIITQKGVLKEIRFHGEGCMICQASASILCDTVEGKSKDQIRQIYDKIDELLTPPYSQITESDLRDKDYLALADIQKYPARKKCAMLAWKALMKGLKD